MILNPDNNVFTCILVEKNNKEKTQIMIILNDKEIKIYRLIKSSFNVKFYLKIFLVRKQRQRKSFISINRTF